MQSSAVTPANINKFSTKSSAQYVSHRNNAVDNKLAGELEQYERQRVLNISKIDHDRVTLRQFLRDIYRCESDKDPAIRYLDDPPSTSSLIYRQYEDAGGGTAARQSKSQHGDRIRPTTRHEPSAARRPATQPQPSRGGGYLPAVTAAERRPNTNKKMKLKNSLLPRIEEMTVRRDVPGTAGAAAADDLAAARRRSLASGGESQSNADGCSVVATVMNVRGRSKSKVEMDLIQKVLDERHRRHRLNLLFITAKVNEFCAGIEEYKSQQRLEAEPPQPSLAF